MNSIHQSQLKQSILERFTRYVQIDTQSSTSSSTYPSTTKQFDLAKLLAFELQAMGIADAHVDEHCYVTATIPATVATPGPVIGLLAHVDTSPDVRGNGVTPHIIENYQGGNIVISAENNVILDPAESPELTQAIGHTIVTAGGTTLLGADDKAGVAAIMAVAEFLIHHPEIPHHAIRIGFTPDEEIGKGVELFDIVAFGADFAYTIDGGFTGEINNETFSADSAVITVSGRDMHPGYARDRMINAVRVMAAIVAQLPGDMAPETTGGRDGYIHPNSITGSVGVSTLKLLLRDFTEDGLETKRIALEKIIGGVRATHPGSTIELDIKPTYRNMYTTLQKTPEVLSRLELAVKKAGIEPVWKPIRGGTDGAVLTARGLPTPNIFTAACNPHSLTEWVDIDGLTKCGEALVYLVTKA